MKILSIGEIVLDKIYLLDSYPEEGSKVSPINGQYSVGGSVVTALITMARMGAECTLIGAVGNDELGRSIKKRLEEERITFVPTIQRVTKVNNVLVNRKNGSRTIIKDYIKSKQISNISERILSEHDMVLTDRNVPVAFEEVISKKTSKTKVLADTSTDSSLNALKMLKNSDYPIVAIEALAKFRKNETLYQNINRLYSEIEKPIIITAGEKGSLIFDGRKIKVLPAIKIKAIDSLGAGDVFRGVFIYAVLSGYELIEAVKIANVGAALQCTKIGSVSAIPTKQEIFNFAQIAKTIEIDIKDFGLDDTKENINWEIIN